MGSLVKQCFPYNAFLLLLLLFQIRCQVPPSARALHYFDKSTHDSVQRLQPLCHVGREEHENDSVLLHQLLELVCFVHRCIVTKQTMHRCIVCFVNRCIVTHQQHTLSGERIRARLRRLLLQPPRRQDSLNVNRKPPCIHPRLGLAGDNVPILVLQVPSHMLKFLCRMHRLAVFLASDSLETLPLLQSPTRTLAECGFSVPTDTCCRGSRTNRPHRAAEGGG
jgi:hypothetical protein